MFHSTTAASLFLVLFVGSSQIRAEIQQLKGCFTLDPPYEANENVGYLDSVVEASALLHCFVDAYNMNMASVEHEYAINANSIEFWEDEEVEAFLLEFSNSTLDVIQNSEELQTLSIEKTGHSLRKLGRKNHRSSFGGDGSCNASCRDEILRVRANCPNCSYDEAERRVLEEDVPEKIQNDLNDCLLEWNASDGFFETYLSFGEIIQIFDCQSETAIMNFSSDVQADLLQSLPST